MIKYGHCLNTDIGATCYLSTDRPETGYPSYINELIHAVPIIHVNEQKWKHFMRCLSIYEDSHENFKIT